MNRSEAQRARRVREVLARTVTKSGDNFSHRHRDTTPEFCAMHRPQIAVLPNGERICMACFVEAHSVNVVPPQRAPVNVQIVQSWDPRGYVSADRERAGRVKS